MKRILLPEMSDVSYFLLMQIGLILLEMPFSNSPIYEKRKDLIRKQMDGGELYTSTNP